MLAKYDFVILGGGPGGYVAALRAAQLKKSVALIERDSLGGTCTNYGCIPTKYLLHKTKIFKEFQESRFLEGKKEKIVLNWSRVLEEKRKIVARLARGVEFLLKKNGVEFIKGYGHLKNEKQMVIQVQDEEKIIEGEKIILATGSRAAELPFLKPDGEKVITSQEALELAEIPRSILVIGAGAIGLEMATIFSRLGTKVTVLEIMAQILPGCDREMSLRLERILKAQGLEIFTQMKIETCHLESDKIILRGTSLKTRAPFEFRAEKILLAVGRKPNSEEIQKSLPQIALKNGGFIEVDSYLETSVPDIFAVGDLRGGKLLAHKAFHEGVLAVENALGEKKLLQNRALPLAVFTDPEFASVGLTEEEAKERGIKVQTGLFPLQANGRAATLEVTEGMVKLLASEEDEVIGAHIISPQASEFISEVTLAINRGLTIRDLSSSIHIHPTLSEALAEAALKAKNRALHILNF